MSEDNKQPLYKQFRKGAVAFLGNTSKLSAQIVLGVMATPVLIGLIGVLVGVIKIAEVIDDIPRALRDVRDDIRMKFTSTPYTPISMAALLIKRAPVVVKLDPDDMTNVVTFKKPMSIAEKRAMKQMEKALLMIANNPNNGVRRIKGNPGRYPNPKA